jgi:CheY-like chemotaxis protein
VSTLLGSLGAEVRAAATVADALETVRDWRPNVVLSDIGMPGIDGYALVAALRARERELGVVPAIALTAYASRDDRIRILAAGFRTHVTKPIDPMELAASVASVIRR